MNRQAFSEAGQKITREALLKMFEAAVYAIPRLCSFSGLKPLAEAGLKSYFSLAKLRFLEVAVSKLEILKQRLN